MEAQTLKNQCSETAGFGHRFFEGFGPGFQRLFVGFSNWKCVKKATWRKVSESHFVLEKPIRNRCRHSCDKAFFQEKSMKNRIVFGTSTLTGFWKGFGKALGGQNPWFSHFFRCFSMQNLECNLEAQKIEKIKQNWPEDPNHSPEGSEWQSLGGPKKLAYKHTPAGTWR